MPMHDWTRVPAGIYHHFHNAWITRLTDWLNGGSLPEDYYALGEQRGGDIHPDVLTLHASELEPVDLQEFTAEGGNGGTVVAVAQNPPQVESVHELAAEMMFYQTRQRRIAIRHVSGDDLVAVVEIVSPSNKHGSVPVEEFVDKAVALLQSDVHLTILDPFPPNGSVPNGFNDLIAVRFDADNPPLDRKPGRDRTLTSYDAVTMTAYFETLSVGEPLKPIPLFLKSDHYLNLDLATTCDRAYQHFPRRFKRILE